jgi:hypothetical protein
MDLAARFRARRIFSVPEAAGKVLVDAPNYADAHLMLAVTAFRRGQFARARCHAHDFIRTDPAWALMGREIILASRLVWFPPFLWTHLLIRLARSGAALEGTGPALGTVGKLLAQSSSFDLLLRLWLVTSPAWFVYENYVIPRMGALLSGHRRPVRLDADY